MDKFDKKIVRILEADSRISFSKLADDIGLSKTPCWQRVKQLENDGIIQGYKTQLDVEKLGFEIKAVVFVVIDFAQSEPFEQAVQQHKSISRCTAVTGDYDYLLEVVATNIRAFDHLLRKDLAGLPGVKRFNTSLSTREVKQHFAISELI
ncbi:MAG: Lrp/AsnC family transcriptional regulator [Pseudomonadota bacterium]